MKPYPKLMYLLLLICMILIDCGCNRNKNSASSYETNERYFQRTSSCDLTTAIFIGRLYALSCPSISDNDVILRDLVGKYSELLNENGEVIRCMNKLGRLMVQQGIQNFNFTNAQENQVRSNIMEMANEVGLTNGVQISDNIVSGMKNEQLQPIMVGNELIWLSSVLSSAADGNWYEYQSTGTIFRREAIRQIEYIKQVIDIYTTFDPSGANILEGVMPLANNWAIEYGQGYVVGCGVYLGVFKK